MTLAESIIHLVGSYGPEFSAAVGEMQGPFMVVTVATPKRAEPVELHDLHVSIMALVKDTGVATYPPSVVFV